MKKSNKQAVKISYDPEADVLSWEISSSAKIDYATEMGNVVVHFSKKGLPVLIEVLDAFKLLTRSERTIAKARDLTFAS